MIFHIGEKVVYPNQGVGIIENISSRSFGMAAEKFYLLRFGYNSMTVLVPFSTVDHIGLRRLTQDREISRILSFLSSGGCGMPSDWKLRYKENSEKMQSGNLLKVAEVFHGLLRLHAGKSLSFREKKMLERSRHMLIEEIATARRVPELRAGMMLDRALAKGGLAQVQVQVASA